MLAQVPVQRGDVVLVGSDDLFNHLTEAEVLAYIDATVSRAAAAAAGDPWRALGGTSSSARAAALPWAWRLRHPGSWLASMRAGAPCGRLARELVRRAKHNWAHPTGDITAIAGLVR